MNRIKVILIALASIGLLSSSLTSFAKKTRTIVGKAYDAKTQAYLYAEDHVFNDDPANASMTSNYRDPDGEVIAQKVVRFEQGRVTEIEFEQSEMGVARKLTREPSLISYSSTEDNKTSNTQFKLKPNKEVIVDAGLFMVVDRNWQALLEGEKVKFDLAMPDKKRTIGMIVSLSEVADSTAPEVMETDNVVMLSMKISSRLLRWLAPTIELGYYKDTKQLAFYKGPSNLHDESGKAMKPIYIVYERSENFLAG